jgi:hypothetical protein
MRKLLLLLVVLGLACNTLLPTRPAPTATVALTAPTALPTFTPVSTLSQPTETPIPIPSPTVEAEYGLRPSDVTFHPDPQLYSGDIVSLEISAENANPDWEDASVNVFIGARTGEPLATEEFDPFGIGERAQATFQWVWDTTGLEGQQTVVISVDPKGVEGDLRRPLEPLDVLTITVTLLPANQRPMPEPLTQWRRAESECCIFHYLTNTAAARDIEHIQAEADVAFAQVEETLGVQQNQKVSFTLLSRLLGHGGFASEEISLTYIDRNPAGLNLNNVFVHEGTHILDRQISQTKPTIMTEGLAVYVAGGHFKLEDLNQRAAALLVLGRYIPLAELTDSFYPSQHEIGYLEGGAFTKYLVDRFGWARFKKFYSSFKEAPTQSQMLNAALQENFAESLTELEASWLAQLRSLPPDEDQIEDLRLTIMLYDTLRRYQQLDDPAAYFLTAWLPDGPEARRRGIVADFVRHPNAPENIALETMLVAAGVALETGDFVESEALLDSVNAVLDANNLFLDPLAADYLQIVTRLGADGYEAQTIMLNSPNASATAIRDWPTLNSLTLTRTATGWQLSAAETETRAGFAGSIILEINRINR